jgi:hypothetical protein
MIKLPVLSDLYGRKGINMKQFTIKITDDGKVYINDELCKCDYPMDKENKEDDLNKRAILALADKMGYEAVFLFEEMAQRLDEMLDEFDDDFEDEEAEEYDDDNDFLQGLIDDDCIEETIKIWLDNLLEATGKSSVDELTVEEIRAEIEEMRGTIRNEECLLGVYEYAEDNLKQMFKYLDRLEEMLNGKEENK